jgi:hypothetical protein
MQTYGDEFKRTVENLLADQKFVRVECTRMTWVIETPIRQVLVGFLYRLSNGWTVSIQFSNRHNCSMCDFTRFEYDRMVHIEQNVINAETAAWDGQGPTSEVKGWQTPAQAARFIAEVANR